MSIVFYFGIQVGGTVLAVLGIAATVVANEDDKKAERRMGKCHFNWCILNFSPTLFIFSRARLLAHRGAKYTGLDKSCDAMDFCRSRLPHSCLVPGGE